MRADVSVSSLFFFFEGCMEKQKFGTLDIEPIDVEELMKKSKEEIEAMWEEASNLQWKE